MSYHPFRQQKAAMRPARCIVASRHSLPDAEACQLSNQLMNEANEYANVFGLF